MSYASLGSVTTLFHTLGQLRAAVISLKIYEVDRDGLIPGYDPYTLTVAHPQDSTTRNLSVS